MDVDHPVAPALDETVAEDAHEARETDELDPGRTKPTVDLGTIEERRAGAVVYDGKLDLKGA
jgi:hypothetical protein